MDQHADLRSGRDSHPEDAAIPFPTGPAGALIELDESQRVHLLQARNLALGRGEACEIRLEDAEGLSREHARLNWNGLAFELTDCDSSYGTFVNGRRLDRTEHATLSSGDQLRLGERTYVLQYFAAGTTAAPRLGMDRYMELARALTSLDPREIVTRGLELLRRVSGVERSLLVGAGADPTLEPLLTPLEDPELRVSRSAIQQALLAGTKVEVFVSEQSPPLTESMMQLGLHRIWVRPVAGVDGRPVAAVYLDSPNEGVAFPREIEEALETVTDHIGMALRNASLYAQVVDTNQNLERKVSARTRELEESRAQLIASDRLATLGRLVAAIAHELNNPVGAIASFTGTLKNLLEPLLELRTELEKLLPDADDRVVGQALLDASLKRSRCVPADTRTRRELEEVLERTLSSAEVQSAASLAHRIARIGLTPGEIAPALKLLATRGERLSVMAEQLYTFGRSLETINHSAHNVARIVDGLKTYSHLDSSEAEVADVHRGLQATLSVMSARVPKGIEIVTSFADISPFTHRPGEMTQVWTNLVDNAVRAMGESGTLTVETRDEGDRVRVTFADTGPGVPETIRDRIFELHVTSRGPGAGLGLGLPICKAIVEQNHGGQIAFTSSPGETRFTVLLPKSAASSNDSL